MTNAGGTLRPGVAAPGAFTLTGTEGSYAQTAAGTLALDLAGDQSYDSVNASGGTVGAINLAGNVTATLGTGYTPEFGASFPVLVAKTLTDTATWALPALPAGQAWDQRVIVEGGTSTKAISVAPASSTPLAAGSWTGPGAVGASYALGDAGGTVSVDANVTAGYLQVGGTGNWNIDGSNTLTFSASGTRAGMLAYGSTTTVNAPINFTGNGVIGTATAGTKVTLNGTVAGSGTITKTGPGTLELKNSTSPFSGTWAISRGALNIDADENLGAAGASLHVKSAAVNVTNAWNSARAIELQGTGMSLSAADNSSLWGVTSGSGGLTKNGSGRLTISDANTYTGATTVAAGTLAVGAANAIPAASHVVLTSGTTLELNGNAQTFASLAVSGANPATLTTGGANLTVGGGNTETLFRGNIDGGGAGTFTKTGSGIFQVSGVAAPTGSLDPNRAINVESIVVEDGILQVNNLARNLLALPHSDITVHAGAALSLGGTGSAGGFVTSAITGPGGLQFHGGIVELAADSTYTGPTELRFGSTVVLDSMGALGSSASPIFVKPVTTFFSNSM